jgi:putative two-component system response regulator
MIEAVTSMNSDSIAPKKKLLIVDDEEANTSLLARIVRSAGYDSETASNGDEALSKIGDDIDLVMLDVTMPGKDGFEVCRLIRQIDRCRDLPIIMVTGLTGKAERLRAVECGANDFIGKPFERTEVEVRVRALLTFKEMQDALKRQKDHLEIAVAARTHELRDALKRATMAEQETYEAHLGTLKRLAMAAEYKDEQTGGHILRIGEYCAVLAKCLGLPASEVELMQRAGVLHDVGKMGISDSILLKPGKLTEEEFDVMRTHTIIGAKLLDGSMSELIDAGRVVALTHHEKWDGSGYPNGLSGERIPLWGRICAVADVFDALTSERPYKRAFTNEEAYAILERDAGKHFDPLVVDVFLKNTAAIEHVQALYKQKAPRRPQPELAAV